MKASVVYILAASHSGSTLLAMLLGSHPDSCTAGELKATSLGDPERYLCSCGALAKKCSFWREVSRRMGGRGIEFEITSARTDLRAGASWYTRRVLKPLHRGRALECIRDAALAVSPTWRRRRPEIDRRNLALIETLCDVHGARMIVDSSKIGLRLKYLLRIPELEVKIVRLIRDGRGVALSYLDPYVFADARDPQVRCGGIADRRPTQATSMHAAAYEWRRSNEEAERIIERLERPQWVEVRYENLCTDPNSTLERLFRFLGLDPARRVKDFRSRGTHVLGNGMRLDSTTEIRLDDRWRQVLTAADLRCFETVAGRMSRRYGYT